MGKMKLMKKKVLLVWLLYIFLQNFEMSTKEHFLAQIISENGFGQLHGVCQ